MLSDDIKSQIEKVYKELGFCVSFTEKEVLLEDGGRKEAIPNEVFNFITNSKSEK